MNKDQTIFSCFDGDREVLDAVSKMYLGGKWFECDPTFSKGVIHDGKLPRYRSDISPQAPDVEKKDCRDLGFDDNSISSILFS